MRLRSAALLALPVSSLSPLVSAAPSPTHGVSNPLAPAAPRLESAWRRLSDKIIVSLWGSPKCADCQADMRPATSKTSQQLPSHTLAQYGSDVVLRFNVSTAEEVESLSEAADTLLLDVWEFSRDWVDIRLAENLVPSLLGLLPTSLHHAHVPLLRENELARAIHDTYPSAREHESPGPASPPLPPRPFSPTLQPSAGSSGPSNIFFADYQPLSVILPWMKLLSSLFTTHTRLVHIGKTYQDRDIHALRIGVHPTNRQDSNPKKRKTILITAGLHAREWISTSTATYIAYGLITGYGKNAQITNMLESFDFVIVPTLNPDGYVYTWETDRLWRKNRQTTPLRFCQGLDLDHSFGFEWPGDATSSNACSEAYAGEHPFQATEAQRLANWARNETERNNVEFVSFIDLHSYSQQILYPYGYTCETAPPGLEDLEELAYGLEKAIRVSHGHYYEVMSACEANNFAAGENGKKNVLPHMEHPGGSALDFFYHDLRVRWAYQIKLRDKGTYGFLLPREHIVPTGKEMLDAMMYLGSFLMEAYEEKSGVAEEVKIVKGDVEDYAPPPPQKQSDELEHDEAWLKVKDLREEDVQWDLKRKRRR